MARKRIISPEFFTSESVASLPIPTRLTYVGLWVYLDDFGRGKDNAALIKATVWPLDDNYTVRKVSADLAKLAATGTVCRYECCGRQIHVPRWSEWQKISHPTPTRLCPCPSHERDGSRIHREEFRRSSGAALPNVIESNSSQCSSSDPTARANPTGSSFGSPCEHGALFGSPCIECRGLRVVNE